MITVSNAFKLAGTIGFYYKRRSIHTTEINDRIAKELGPDLYKKFCAEMRNGESRVQNLAIRKHFEVDEKKYMNDMEFYTNYSLNSLMETLARTVS